MNRQQLIGISVLALAACTPAAVETGTEDGQTVDAPTVEQPASAPTRNAYFGDVHVHTGNSFDAYVFGVRASPDDAYRFAKGESIHHDAGYEIQLAGPPLDFLAVTDHGEYLGVIPAMDDPTNALSQTDMAQAAFGPDRADAAQVFQQIGLSFVIGQPIEEINDQDQMNSVWAKTIAAAEQHNIPGEFSAFAAYEFTAMRLVDGPVPAAANLHRNVIFRGAAPDQLFTTLNSTNPEDLWSWMNEQRAQGIDSLAIPHNSNASNGEMFALETYSGAALTADYANTRRANEPLVEITQIKGTSDTLPELSPNDEWAEFERYDHFIGSSEKLTVGVGDFVRSSLARGLAIEDEIGVNPYMFGLIGSSDTHIGAATLEEEKHWGKFPTDGSSPEARSSVPPNGAPNWDNAESEGGRVLASSQYSASGLAGVWAEANTREAIFDAMRRRETFGTSGPRIKVRFFAGAALDAALTESADLVEQAYATSVPMGGQIMGDTEDSPPGFIAWAVRDPLSAPLQRLQIIKTWTENGALHEAVFDAACSDGSTPDPESHRCADNGASVDVATCARSDGTGTGELKAFWRDPSFDPSVDAAYYVRVLENPSCRWSTWDAVRAGTPPNPGLPETLQERAWSSPIWYSAPS